MGTLITKSDCITTHWSGGRTTELLIWPPKSQYSKLNFAFRVSQATMDMDTSVYTSLPGVRRKLMLLEGHLSLCHDGHHNAELEPLQQDVFDGAWHTTSYGRGRDFNLMLRENADGSLAAIILAPRESTYVPLFAPNERLQFTIVYPLRGTARLQSCMECQYLQPSNFYCAQAGSTPDILTIRNTGSEPFLAAIAQVLVTNQLSKIMII